MIILAAFSCYIYAAHRYEVLPISHIIIVPNFLNKKQLSCLICEIYLVHVKLKPIIIMYSCLVRRYNTEHLKALAVAANIGRVFNHHLQRCRPR